MGEKGKGGLWLDTMTVKVENSETSVNLESSDIHKMHKACCGIIHGSS